MRLGSHVAVPVVLAGSCSSNLTPSLGTSMCHGCGPKKEKKKVYKQQMLERGWSNGNPHTLLVGM